MRQMVELIEGDVMAQLPKVKYQGGEEETECTICMVDYNGGEEITMLPCFHKFHPMCIGAWFKKEDNCPICQTQIVKK